jgi:uncharacterized SAM-binding protein YcdF (DUF218 family)
MKHKFKIVFLILCVALAGTLVVRSGRLLVVDQPQPVDVIVVLCGDHNDVRFWHGMELLRKGFARRMIVDADATLSFGRTSTERAAEFIAKAGGNLSPQISVCPVTEDSTVAEAANVTECMAQLTPAPHSGMIVTHAYHTRRALSIFRHRLPQYLWVASAAQDEDVFGQPWWRRREWAKINLTEWQKLLWWEIGEKWRI